MPATIVKNSARYFYGLSAIRYRRMCERENYGARTIDARLLRVAGVINVEYGEGPPHGIFVNIRARYDTPEQRLAIRALLDAHVDNAERYWKRLAAPDLARERRAKKLRRALAASADVSALKELKLGLKNEEWTAGLRVLVEQYFKSLKPDVILPIHPHLCIGWSAGDPAGGERYRLLAAHSSSGLDVYFVPTADGKFGLYAATQTC